MFRGREKEKGGPDFSGFRRIRFGKNGAEKIFEKEGSKNSGNLSEKVSCCRHKKKTAMVAV